MAIQKIKWVRICLLCAAIALIVIGLTQGEARTVLEKGIRICLECIGIG